MTRALFRYYSGFTLWAGNLGIPIFEHARRVVLPDPGMQNIHAKSFIQMEVLTEQLWWMGITSPAPLAATRVGS